MPNAGIMASSVVIAAGTDVLLEPFNNLTAWTSGSGGTIVAGGRTGTAVEFSAFSGADRSYTIPTGDQSDTITVGFGFRANAIGSGTYTIIGLRSDSGAVDHDRIDINSAGTLSFLRASSILASSTVGVIAATTWYYLEVQVKMHDTLGTYEVRLNGSPIIGPATGQDTRNAGTKAVFDTVRLVPSGFNAQIVRFDDLYVTMGAGAPFKGPITIP